MDRYFMEGESPLLEEEDRDSIGAGGRFEEMQQLLEKTGMPYYDDEVVDYLKMFDVIGELTGGRLTLAEMTEAFSQMVKVMEDKQVRTARAKMQGMFALLEEIPETQGKLDHKEKLFFSFCVYAACSVISENDDKKHHFMGLPEFESTEYIKYRMEEYWGFDPFMFSWAVK